MGAEDRILESAKRCCERWGFDRVTIDDIARDAKVSRATLYRLFPGGKEVLFEAMRVKELDEFFTTLLGEVEGAGTLDELLTRTVVCATRELRADEHLALMLASSPGETVSQLTTEGLPRIVRVASAYLAPLVAQHLDRPTARRLIDVLARLVISYFLAPSDEFDLADDASARDFLRPFLHTFTGGTSAEPLTDPTTIPITPIPTTTGADPR